MSMHKSSMTTGTPAMKIMDWTKVPDEELATDLDDMDLRYEGQKRHDKRLNGSARQKRQKNAGRRRRRGIRGKQKQKQEAEERKHATAAEARKWQQADSEAQVSGSWVNPSACIRCARLRLTCSIPAGVKKRSACRLCMKAKERCKWPEVEMMASRAGASPQGREHKKQAKKVADDDDDDKIVILSSQKTKQQGGSKMLEEITNQQWGELIQAVSTPMDVANGHLEQIASAVQSNSHKVQWHHLLMEGLVGQQQVLLSKLVEGVGATGSGGAGEVVEDPEEPKEAQGEGSGGQEEIKGVPGGALGDEPENALGNEPENGAGVEDGTEEEAQKDKGKGKEKAL
ncbi:hypothetical protein ID866_12468 [Astraeus odoratus]|nr:hypothetical protein ID866_12468 [Astraeus odoratus]